ncbi:MAG TPA: DNA polymerase III subunit delta [Candidatus Paceibacterota bacterium]|mgnify:CR=1 FL=1|nr:DNA polymerase III subunit delta [Candidatus Paceibacterota bacterium]
MLYFFYGADSYLIKTTYTDLFLKLAPKGSKIEDFVLDGSDPSTGDTLAQSFSTTSLFSNESLIILKDFILTYNKWGKIEQKKLKDYFEKSDISSSKTKNLIWIEGNLKAKDIDNPLGHFIKKVGAVNHLESLKGLDFKKWLANQAKERGINLEPTALTALATAFEGETSLIDQYLTKIALANLKIVSLEELEKLVYLPLNENIFALIGAATQGDKSRAQFMLQKELESGAHPLYILTMFVYGFRSLLMIQSALKTGKDVYKESGLAPFTVRANLGLAQKMSPIKLKNIYNRLTKLDGILKRGQVDPSLALMMFIQSL